MITTVQCSICSQLNNKTRVAVTDIRLHNIYLQYNKKLLWLHSLSGVIRSLLWNPRAFSPGIIIISVCANTCQSALVIINIHTHIYIADNYGHEGGKQMHRNF